MGTVASRKNVEKVARLARANPNKLGPKFGVILYRSNIPASCAIAELGITEPTLYRWIFGKTDISEDRQPGVMALIKQLTKAKTSGILPAKGDVNQRTESFELAMAIK